MDFQVTRQGERRVVAVYFFFLVMSSKENQRSISHYDRFLMINKLVTKLEVRAYD